MRVSGYYEWQVRDDGEHQHYIHPASKARVMDPYPVQRLPRRSRVASACPILRAKGSAHVRTHTLVNLTWPELMDWLTLSAVPDEPIPSSFNRPPTTTIPIVRQAASGPEGAIARWGLVPEWFKGSLREWRANTINARAEEVARKPSFRDAYRHKRCIVPVSRYYEWHVRDDGKHPHYIHSAGNAPALLMAGLWSDVHLPNYAGLTATVLTEPVRSPPEAVLNRMPLMLERRRWPPSPHFSPALPSSAETRA